MKKLLNSPGFVALLALVALGFVAHSLWPRADASYARNDDATLPVETAEVAAPPARGQSIADALARLEMGTRPRDPFAVQRQETSDGVSRPDLLETVHLAALWSQQGEVYAVLNGRICRVGDELGRVRLEEATLEGVWLSHWRGRDFLKLGATFTLVTPARTAAASLASHES